MGKISATLFDCDGVLVNGARWHEEAFNCALGDFGCDPLTHEEHLETFNGLSTYRKLSILTQQGRFLDDDMYKQFYDTKQKYTIEIINQKCRPTTRVIDVINYASSFGPTAVVTNCSRVTAELMLSCANLTSRFNVIITNNDVDGKIKPDPYPYIKACRVLDINPENTLAIDDNQRGIESARRAKCNVWELENFEDLTVMNLMRMASSFGGFYDAKRMA